jgi:hypothetical protein
MRARQYLYFFTSKANKARQYLYFCTSKASKLIPAAAGGAAAGGAAAGGSARGKRARQSHKQLIDTRAHLD